MLGTRDTSPWNLIELSSLSAAEIKDLLDRAAQFRKGLMGESANSREMGGPRPRVALLFSEPSTRTSLSFRVACQELGVDVVELPADRSSLLKGESMLDTAQVLEALGAGAIVVRDKSDEVIDGLAEHCRAGVLNAGGGTKAHPSQGLLDARVLLDHFENLEGRRIGILGDVVHSRVARSDAVAFTALGAEVVLIGPREFLSETGWPKGVSVSTDLDAELPRLDAIQVLRIQHERIEGGMGLPLSDYISEYQLDEKRLESVNSKFCVLHPGPMNRGVEISSGVADGPRSQILDQVSAGVYVRMALVEKSLGLKGLK